MDSYEKKQKNNRKRIIMIGIVTVIVAGIVLAITPKLQSAVKDNKSNKTTTSVTTTVEHTLPDPFENSVSYEISNNIRVTFNNGTYRLTKEVGESYFEGKYSLNTDSDGNQVLNLFWGTHYVSGKGYEYYTARQKVGITFIYKNNTITIKNNTLNNAKFDSFMF